MRDETIYSFAFSYEHYDNKPYTVCVELSLEPAETYEPHLAASDWVLNDHISVEGVAVFDEDGNTVDHVDIELERIIREYYIDVAYREEAFVEEGVWDD